MKWQWRERERERRGEGGREEKGKEREWRKEISFGLKRQCAKRKIKSLRSLLPAQWPGDMRSSAGCTIH